MKEMYLSEITGKTYSSKKECLVAEAEFTKAKEAEEAKKAKAQAERTVAAKRVDDAVAKVNAAKKALKEADEALSKELSAFCEKYGPWHTSISLDDIFDDLFYHIF